MGELRYVSEKKAAKERMLMKRMAQVELEMRLDTYSYPKGIPKGRFDEESGQYVPNKSELLRALGFHEDYKQLLALRQRPEYDSILLECMVDNEIRLYLENAEHKDVNKAVLNLISRQLLLSLTLYPDSIRPEELLRLLPTYQRLVGEPPTPLSERSGDIYADVPDEVSQRLAMVRRR